MDGNLPKNEFGWCLFWIENASKVEMVIKRRANRTLSPFISWPNDIWPLFYFLFIGPPLKLLFLIFFSFYAMYNDSPLQGCHERFWEIERGDVVPHCDGLACQKSTMMTLNMLEFCNQIHRSPFSKFETKILMYVSEK